MNQLSKGPDPEIIQQPRGETSHQPTKVDMIVIGIVTGVAATAIIQTGRGIITTLAKNPLVMFGLGIASGCFAHKYRKEIVTLSNKAGEQSKDFMRRQQQCLQEMLASPHESTEKPDDLPE